MEQIKITFPFNSPGLSEDLERWITKNESLGPIQIDSMNKAVPNALGVVEILGVILASKAVIELVKCITVWIKANRIKATIKVNIRGTEIDLELDNLKDEITILNTVKNLVRQDD